MTTSVQKTVRHGGSLSNVSRSLLGEGRRWQIWQPDWWYFLGAVVLCEPAAMSLRSARQMTSIFLIRGNRILLLYRVGSSAIRDSWVGIGGHVDPDEIRDPTQAALRELEEEVGLSPDQIRDLTLRYVSLRDNGEELRITYYFTATLPPGTPDPEECTEGELRWFEIAPEVADLSMPPTTSVALKHWLSRGRHDNLLRSIVMGADGPLVLPLAGE